MTTAFGFDEEGDRAPKKKTPLGLDRINETEEGVYTPNGFIPHEWFPRVTASEEYQTLKSSANALRTLFERGGRYGSVGFFEYADSCSREAAQELPERVFDRWNTIIPFALETWKHKVNESLPSYIQKIEDIALIRSIDRETYEKDPIRYKLGEYNKIGLRNIARCIDTYLFPMRLRLLEGLHDAIENVHSHVNIGLEELPSREFRALPSLVSLCEELNHTGKMSIALEKSLFEQLTRIALPWPKRW